MHISIEGTVLEKYPRMEIGFLAASVIVKKSDPFVDHLKQTLAKNLQELGINATNFAAHSRLSLWRKIYQEDFHVNPKTYRSSLEALLRRIVTGKELWNICNVVDLYNCCSILSLLPMGGYDLGKISGDIKIRYAEEGEHFQGIGERLKIEAQPKHLVYADDERLICWLWNHKDSIETCIDESTKDVIFFIDSADSLHSGTVKDALLQLSRNLEKIGSVPMASGILNCNSPYARLPEGPI